MRHDGPVTSEPSTVPDGGPTPALIAACRGARPSHRPVWFMRQAGRSLPEYRAVRQGTAMLQACRTPDLVTEITLQPVRRYGVDGAVFYSDIVVPLHAAGIDVDIVAGVGPVLGSPVRDVAGVAALPELTPDQLGFVTQAVQMLVAELGEVPLIGFAGAPFTVASYLVEGGPSKTHERTKALMYGHPQLWDALLRRIAGYTTTFLQVQIDAGARVVQLFDSWVGALPEADYRAFVQPHSARVLAAIAAHAPDVPRIHFGVGTGELLAAIGEAGADVVGVDFRVPLDVAAARLGPGYSVQGNLDPALLFAPWPVIERRVLAMLAAGEVARGHVANLGHGVPPNADPDVLARITDLVHATTIEW
jgi:uroporphyrinogen decarboxylase